ncbi:hypothetical protein [Plantibacter sp. YIM 135249]|uniref:DUF7882 family protein n=1 Tax=Plantibacter sp. YIM 135249 TaxID=3423918 RepID=UPI003D33F600
MQLVIVSKLRKAEPFLLSWNVGVDQGSGQVAMWIETGIPLAFHYDGSRQITLNRAWLNAMIERSYTTAGLELMPESDHPDTPIRNV